MDRRTLRLLVRALIVAELGMILIILVAVLLRLV